jgi:hypothetical protein
MLYDVSNTISEGEHPEPSGSHDWNKESATDTAKRLRTEQAREQADVIQQARKQDITAHIAGLLQEANTPRHKPDTAVSASDRDKQERANIKHKLRYEHQAGVYSYMRDSHKAKTVGDVEDKLRQHQVEPEVVRVWVEGRMIEHDDLMEQAIAEGYPELDEDKQRMHEKQHWRQADDVNDFLAGLDVDDEDL